MSPIHDNTTRGRSSSTWGGLLHWRSGLRVLSLLGLSVALGSCGGGDDCWNGCGVAFTPYQVGSGVVAADFSHSGFDSIVQASTTVYPGAQPGFLNAYLSSAAGSFAAVATSADGDQPLYIASADLNGDGLPDLVTASFIDGSLNVFFNNAQTPGSFNTPLLLSSPGASQVVIADMNGDDLPDLVSADYNVSLFVQSSAGTFANPISLYAGGANWVAVGDLNADHTPDIALTDNVGVKVLFHTGAAGTTTYAAPVTVFTQTANANVSGANLIAIADVNGDGLNDLIITDPGPTGGAAPTVSVLLQNAASPGTFLPAVSYATTPGSLAQSILVADVNGDNHPDIIIGGTNAVTVLLADASTPGTFLSASSYSAAYANQIALADVNGDGLVDIVVANGATQPLQSGILSSPPGVLLQNAASPGTFSALQNLP